MPADDAAAAFEAAFHAHVRAVRAYALRRTAPEDAADVVAETFAVRGTVPARHQPRSGALAVVLLLVLTGCGGGDAFPARFASEGEDTDHYTRQSVDLAPPPGGLSASIAVSSLYGSSADGHAGRYRFARLSFRLNGVPADT